MSGVIFGEHDADYNYDWRNAAQRQYMIMLDGEIEVSDSGRPRYRGGDVMLLEDATGTGHRTWTVNNRSRRSIFLTL